MTSRRRRYRRTHRVVRRRCSCRGGPTRAHLDVDAEHPAHLGDKVGDRMTRGARAVRSARRPARRCGHIRQREYAVRRDPDRRWRRPGTRCRRRAPAARRSGRDWSGRRPGPIVEFAGALPQRGEVAGTEAPARAGQHPHRRGARGRDRRPAAASPPRRRPRRRPADPARPTTSTGSPRARSASAIGAASALRRTSTAAVGAGAPSVVGLAVARRQVVGDPLPFGGHIVTAARSGPCRARRRGGPAVRGTATERRRASADTALATCRVLGGLRQLVRSSSVGAGAAVGAGEVGGEPRQVGRRRAAPAVDRLDRVADRGQRQPVVDPAAEQRRQRDPLRVPGVLVLVEQHHPEAVPQLRTHLRGTARPAARQRPSACRSPSPSPRATWRAGRRSAGTSSVRSVCSASIRSSH